MNEIVEQVDLKTALATLEPSKYANASMFGAVSSGDGSFLPRLMLMNASSDAVKEGKANQGCYVLIKSKDQIEDLTKEVAVIPLAWRPKAMVIDDGEILNYYNPESADFKEVANRADNEQNSGCMYGPEFLVWVPSHNVFATYFMSSKTARREAPNLRNLMLNHRPGLLRSHLIKAKKFSWFGPLVTSYSGVVNGPPVDEAVEQVKRFNNPAEKQVEKVEDVSDRPQ